MKRSVKRKEETEPGAMASNVMAKIDIIVRKKVLVRSHAQQNTSEMAIYRMNFHVVAWIPWIQRTPWILVPIDSMVSEKI